MPELIFPRKCVLCGTTLAMRKYKGIRENEFFDDLCDKCRAEIIYIEEPVCMKCGKQIESETAEYCFDCFKAKHIYDRGVAVFQYGDAVKKSIYRFKYCNCRKYADFYGTEMWARYKGLLELWKPEAIVPVPIHKKRMKKRGYNQAELIADRLSEVSGIASDKFLLQRVINTVPQKELDGKQRRKNVESAFKVTGNVVKYNKVILVDDIYTTGTTVDACAKALKGAGIKEVYFITICIGNGI